MKPKEIHDLLLSLLVRGLGIWMLYSFFVQGSIDGMVSDFLYLFSGAKDMNLGGMRDDYIRWIAQFGAAVYLILGAPPFLKWATRERR
jgi:hypothetical protein